MTMLLLSLVALSVSSSVDSVVVYPNQVMVVRSASAVVSGPGELVFEGLPGGLDDNSVRVRATGMKLGEVQVKRGYLAEPSPLVKRLKKKVKDLEDRLKKLKDEAEVIKAKVEFLKSIKLGTPEIISKELQQGKVSAQSWREALSFMADEMARAMARQVQLGREQEEVGKQLNAARQEYNDARSAVENRKEVRFDFNAQPGTYRVRLSYVVGDAAKWSPYYELRAKPADAKAEISYFAKLEQKTGEDWDGVKVVLSTNRPVSGLVAPEPSPWYLSLLQPMARMKARGGAKAGEVSYMVDGVASQDAYPAPAPPEAEPVETGISLQYVIPGRVSLKSGEPAKKLLLNESSVPAEYSYYALPRASEQAFLKGRFSNSTGFVLLSGEANTYVGDEFTGSTWLEPVAADESTDVSFGVDERVKVKRELVKSFKSKGGLFSKTERAQFTYKTTVENYLPKQVKIELVEEVPISKQSEIKVTVTKAEPKFLEQDKDKGTYTWKPILMPRDKFEATIEFTVEYPAGKQVQGLY